MKTVPPPWHVGRADRGATIIGALIAAVVVCTMALGAAELLSVNSRILSMTRQKRDRDRVVGNTLHNIMENLSAIQRNFDPSDDVRDKVLAVGRLPLAWDQDKVVPAAQCPDCPGRAGFILQPLEGRAGLNRLTVRLTHKEILKDFRDYVYILSDD